MPDTSYLKLSAEPDFNEPSPNCSPLSVALVELFNTSPLPKVSKVKALVPAPSVPPLRVNTSPNEPPDPVSIVIKLPAVPAMDADIPNLVLLSLTVMPAPNEFAVPILATNLSTEDAASDPVATKKIGELSAGIANGSAAINLNSVPPTVICNSSPSSVKKVLVISKSALANPEVAP